MQTNIIIVDNSGNGMAEVLKETEKFAAYQEFSPKQTIQLRLLAEEMTGMIKGITGNFCGKFHAESSGGKCELHLESEIAMDSKTRNELISVSSKGKNSSAKGIMGKIREIFEIGLLNYDESIKLGTLYGLTYIPDASMGMLTDIMSMRFQDWSLHDYKDAVYRNREDDKGAEDAWDELEKSIVAKLADDVRVSIKGSKVELVITKKFYAGDAK